ncbi:MAG TPA: PPC domain-containing DNA-binding protein [Thermomicrobiaceae bacterium]|nr:PPC domain-containing DNA-binding protein [Thermomicrobiaceae bacterium]
MKAKLLDSGRERTFAIVCDTGDEVMDVLMTFAREHKLDASHFTAIGAFKSATLGFFDYNTKEYRKIPVNEQVEVLSLIGDITLDDGQPKIHAHVVVGRADGTTRGGHILQATVRPTLEIVLSESPAHLYRKTDPETGLALISIEQPSG